MPPDATLPPIRRVLKRSASTASLPTPPRTHSKRGRGRSRGSCDSDSDEQVVLLSDEEELAVSVHKKRRTGEATQKGEDAFWLGTGGMTTRSKRAFGSSNSKAVDPSTQAPLVYRRRQAPAQQQPVSPPPSHRKPMVVSPNNNTPTTPLRTSPRFARAPSTASPPVTPKRKSQRRTTSVLRDSPQNPFLASPLDAAPESDSEESPNQSPKTPYQEKPTVAYVFRGMRREFHNPLYNPVTSRPISPPRGSKLPVEHPAFSPDPSCPPKLLFPEAHKRRNAAKGKAKAKGGNGDDVFGGGDPVKPGSRGATTLDKELRTAEER